MADTIVDLRTSITNRYVFELRYWFGHAYWDRCGKIINEILRNNEDWRYGDLTAGTCRLLREEKNLSFSFGHSKLDLSQAQDLRVNELVSISEFSNLADRFSELVTSVLQVESFPRIGFRCWYLYPTENRQDANDRIFDLGLMRGLRQNQNSLGAMSAPAIQVTVDRPTRQVRVSLSSFEQQIELPPAVEEAARRRSREEPRHQRQVLLESLRAKHMISSLPRCGVLLDLDASIDDPPIGHGVSPGAFLLDAYNDFEKMSPLLLGK